MFSYFKNHPFTVEAYFNNSTILTFAFPKKKLENIIPQHLVLDTFNDKWAFLAVAIVQTTGLRPKGFPVFFSNDFSLVGYRIFVKYTDKKGKSLRGLYILKSETDKLAMEFLGSIFTHYKYTTTDIKITKNTNSSIITSNKSGIKIEIKHTESQISLPQNSPFTNWKEARKFAGPLPFTFSYNPKSKTVLIIEGVRQKWIPSPIHITSYNISYLTSLNLGESILASAFEINNIPYFWRKGKIEKWQ